MPILTTRFILHLRGISLENVGNVTSDFDSIEFADTPRSSSLESDGEGISLRDRNAGHMEWGVNRTVDIASTVGTRSGGGSDSLAGGVGLRCGGERC